ncbi:MAG: CDP-diacylglycerol-inositol 3-phosphatidyltransferase [Claussenomyces sp. TS43310]|nr:MAG: CDP-diacylglycerol-inositol 3-phosphatidyltransferase [Claussenomyces sp. TS43310]
MPEARRRNQAAAASNPFSLISKSGAAREEPMNGIGNGAAQNGLTSNENDYPYENIFVFWPNLIARYFAQSTRFGAVLDMVTDRCTTACLLVFLSSAFPRWSLVFQCLISLDLASHYMHMYATLVMGAGESHKQVDKGRSWILNLYYTNKIVLFLFCALNETFFIALYLLSFSSPLLSPSLLQTSDTPSTLQPGNPSHVSARSLFANPYSAGALELARANKMDSFWPWVIAGVSCPVMFGKQILNVVQLVKASRWLALGDRAARRAAGLPRPSKLRK